MEKKEIKALAEAFCENPKKYRKSEEGVAKFNELDAPVKAKVREILEARRGFRRVNGVIEFTQEALEAEIARLEAKEADYTDRVKAIKKVIAERKEELAERFGEVNDNDK
ncbi:hypothetical protein GW916_01925 [bacterium]|nr:hypothetical protein [bacterium]